MKTGALVLCSLLFALLLCEVVVRVAGLGTTTLSRGVLHEYDPRAGWRCASNLDARYMLPRSFDAHIRCNSQGLRGGEVPREKPAGRTRVAVLGDSFMWGYGVEDDEVFAHVLTREIPDSDAVNLAANGYSTVQELIRFEDVGVDYDPDVVVVGFYWNDLEDNFDDKHGGRPVARLDGDTLHIDNSPVRRHWKAGYKQWLRHHSRLFGFVEYATSLVEETYKLRIEEQRWARRGGSPPRQPRPSAPGVMKFSGRDVYAPPRPEVDRAWLAVRLVLARIVDLERQRGGRTLVLYVPDRYAMSPERFHEFYGDDPELDWNRPSERLAQIARSVGADYLDPSPAFRAAPDPVALFLPRNGHWSAAGHALAARLAAQRILAESGRSGT